MRALAIARVTMRQLLGGKRALALAALSLLPAFVMFFGSARRTDDGAYEFFHDAPFAVMVLIVLPIISLSLGAAALGDERRGSTLSFITLRPLARSNIAGAKIFAAWLASFLIAGGGAVAVAVVAGLRAGHWDVVFPMLILAAVNTLGYSAAFVLLVYITERAVLIGIGFLLIWETAIASAIPGLQAASIFRIGLSAYVGLLPDSFEFLEEPLGSVSPGAGGALIKVAVLTFVGLAATAALLRRRDLA